MYNRILETYKKYPNYIALSFYHKNFSYKWLIENILHASCFLKKIGISKKDKVILCLPNIPQTIVIFYALIKEGIIPCMIHPLSSKNEIKKYIEITHSKYAITLDLFYPNFKEYYDSSLLKKIIVVDGKEYLDPIKMFLYSTKKIFNNIKISYNESILKYSKNIRFKKSSNITQVNTPGNSLSVILFSGGTTGFPKAVMLSNRNFNSLADKILLQIDPVPGKDSMHLMLPLFHGFGLGICMHSVLTGGGRCILVPRFNKSDFINSIIKGKPTYIAGVPTLFKALIENNKIKKANLTYIKGMFVGGDSLSTSLIKKMQQFINNNCTKAFIKEGYGLTECVTACTVMPKNKYVEGSVGLPLQGIEISICAPGTTKKLKKNEEGEICISGDTVMIGYYDNESETSNTLKVHKDKKIWLHTGDLGYINDEGFLFFLQRMKNIIKKSGYSIYPTEVEKALNSLDEINTSCVVGIPDEYKNEKIRAYIVLNEKIQPNSKAKKTIKSKLNNLIIKYSIPDEIVFKKSLPLTKTGKIDRNKIT